MPCTSVLPRKPAPPQPPRKTQDPPVLPCRSHSPEQLVKNNRKALRSLKDNPLKAVRRKNSSDQPFLFLNAGAAPAIPSLPNRLFVSKSA
ncbi:expressed unknown protein [Seminavis robusta]|uniref:Uncharacterized protein n=1 Tax=Seminavis robusta TaxID=568900 RepID=A0A9N8EHG3_9STRA|nr:expressed unknown protein [Seminavis robusta]CAB9521617.1 expressed unknown protein [Seminavis robusta]|eukprot:Sro1214_g253080.1 n/a (90) ;mRNA; f:29808-30077